jgi:hypothetical protein
MKEISARDDFGASDVLEFYCGYNDGQQDFQFFVNADGQADCITDSNGEDYSWDAVWKSNY